jgi:hypothetical protein
VKALVHDPLGVDGAGFENPQDTQNLSSDTRERDQTNLLDAAVSDFSVPPDTYSPATADNTTGSPNQSPQEHQDKTSNEVVPATPTKEQREKTKKKEKKKRQNQKHQQERLAAPTGKKHLLSPPAADRWCSPERDSPKKKQALHRKR